MSSTQENRVVSNLQFRSILCIRPPSSHEQDKMVALEALHCGKVAVMHPPAIKDCASITGNTLQSVKDAVFHFDKVFPPTAAFEKIYAEIGQPLALQSMKPIKSLHVEPEESSPKSHLLVCIGLEESRSSFAYTGSLLLRKPKSDGLLPRIFDSLFAQSKHHIKPLFNNKATFAVSMTVLHVKQSKKSPHDCQIFDLLVASDTMASSKVRMGFRINQGINFLRKSTTRKLMGRQEQVIIQQNPDTMDSHVANVVQSICATAEGTQEKFDIAMRQLWQNSDQNYHSHLFINLQPILMSAHSGRMVQRGSSITVIDMARFACEPPTQRLHGPVRVDAHTAVINCLKVAQANKNAKIGANCMVPYSQHVLTMLLQPLFTSDSLSVTVMLSIDQTSLYYQHKMMLLAELQLTALNAKATPHNKSNDDANGPQAQYESEFHEGLREFTISSSKENRKSGAIIHFHDVRLSSSNKESQPVQFMDSSMKICTKPLPPPKRNGKCDLSFDGSPSKASRATAPTEELIDCENKCNLSLRTQNVDSTECLDNVLREQKQSISNSGRQRKQKDSPIFERSSIQLHFPNDKMHDGLCPPSNLYLKNMSHVTRDCGNSLASNSVDNVGLTKWNSDNSTRLDDAFFSHMAMMNNLH